MVGKGLVVTEKVYWRLVDLKFAGKYRSIDETIRPLIGVSPGKNPRLKNYEDEPYGVTK